MNRIKVGPRGRLATIPDGWKRVENGLCKKEDMFANTVTGKFQNVEWDDIGCDCKDFDLLIRKI